MAVSQSGWAPTTQEPRSDFCDCVLTTVCHLPLAPLPVTDGPSGAYTVALGVSPGNMSGEGPAAQGFEATTTTPAPPASQAACSALEFIHVESQSKPLSALTRKMLREAGV